LELSKKPLCIDMYAGLFGWGTAFAAEGFRVIGFDLEDMSRKFEIPRPDGCELVLQDIRTLHGSQFRDATVIVASPPCQAYSYRAMPWKRAKSLPPPSNELFDACFRIQREACEAARHHIPMVVENVKGAQPWVGKAKAHFGSFYLWGDVPALMPIAGIEGVKQHGSGPSWFDNEIAKHGSHSAARKHASAMIARIPFTLARHIASVFKQPYQ